MAGVGASGEIVPHTSILLFKGARTTAVDFSAVFGRFGKSLAPSTAQALAHASSTRALFTTNLEGLAKKDPNCTTASAIASAEQYFPYLFGLIEAARALAVEGSVPTLKVYWTSCTSTQFCEKLYTCDDWHFEVVNTLIAYAMLFRKGACAYLEQAGGANFEEVSKPVAHLLSRAAGVLDYANEVELSKWTNKPDMDMPEKLSETFLVLSTICLAEAQQVVVKKAILKGSRHASVAMLCLDVEQKYRYASSLLERVCSRLGNPRFFIPQMAFYCRMNAALYGMVARKHLAVAAFDEGKYGVAIGYLQWALTFVDEVNRIPSQRADGAIEVRAHLQNHTNRIADLYKKYSKDNGTIYFERVVPKQELQLPPARCIVKAVPFQPPAPVLIEVEHLSRLNCAVM